MLILSLLSSSGPEDLCGQRLSFLLANGLLGHSFLPFFCSGQWAELEPFFFSWLSANVSIRLTHEDLVGPGLIMLYLVHSSLMYVLLFGNLSRVG